MLSYRRMFEEGQLYSPVTQSSSGAGTVHLGADHPGFQDAADRERRNAIAASALAGVSGTVPSPVPYTDGENEGRRLVTAELAVKHERSAVREFLDAKRAVALPEGRVPQLFEPLPSPASTSTRASPRAVVGGFASVDDASAQRLGLAA